MEILTEYALEIFFGLISAGALAFCRFVLKKNKELNEIMKADQNRQYRQMVLNEIEPIIEEIHRVKSDLTNGLQKAKAEADSTHVEMYKDLELVTKKNDKNLELIINSYKFRFIQLCKTHLRDQYITQDEFEQMTEMYKLYHGLGGNGQAQEYYERVLELPLVEKSPVKE